jgi:hypothetical protein
MDWIELASDKFQKRRVLKKVWCLKVPYEAEN